MKHNYVSSRTRTALNRALLVLVMLAMGVVSYAAGGEKTITPIELDKSYDMKPFVDAYYSFVAPKSGVAAAVATNSDVPMPYSDASFTTEVKNQFSYTGNGGAQREFQVESGKTYYLSVYTMNSKGSFKVTMGGGAEAKLDTVSVTPAPNSTFDITKRGMLSIQFNKSVAYGSATLSFQGKTQAISGNVNGSTLSFDLKAAIFNLLASKAVSAGEPLAITIEGLCSTLDASDKFGTDGKLELNYVVPQLPTFLTGKTVPEKLKSYWPKGDKNGTIVLEFSNELAVGKAKASLGYGNIEKQGEYYYEELPVTVSGNTLTVDLTDSTRTAQSMLPSSTEKYDAAGIKISNVTDKDGNLCFSESSASLGSYSFSLPLDDVTSEVDWEFTPKAGSDLSNTDNLEIYIVGENAITYDGVKFEYTNAGVRASEVVGNDKITREPDEDGVALKVPVPEKAKTGSRVVVSLDNLKGTDGVKRNISALYNHLQVTLVKPDTAKIEKLGAEDSVIITTNMTDKIGYMRFQIRDLFPESEDEAIVKSFADMKKDTVNNVVRFVQENFYDIPFLEGHQYAIEFTGWTTEMDANYGKEPVDSAWVVFSGYAKPYQYSDAKFVSITPDPTNTVIASVNQNKFDVQFTGPVTINGNLAFINTGFGTQQAFQSIEAVDEGDTETTKYSKKWRLTVSPAFMETIKDNLTLSVAAEDAQGRRVLGTHGKENLSFFNFSYDATIGIPDFSSVEPYSGSIVAKLDTIKVSYSGGIGEYGAAKSAKVYDKAGNEVTFVKATELYIPKDKEDDWSYVPTTINLILDQPVTAQGVYTVVLPKQYLILGQDMNTYLSKADTLKYTIGDPSKEVVYTFDPLDVTPAFGEDVTVSKLDTLQLTYAEKVAINPTVAANSKISVIDKMTRQEVGTATAAISKTDPTQIVIALDKAVDKAGTYVVNVPKGLIGNEAYATSDYKLGLANDEYAYTYAVAEEISKENVTSDPAEGSTVASLKKIVLTFVDATDVAPSYDPSYSIELLDAEGNKVADAESDMDFELEMNQIPVELKSEVTKAGTYTLHIPAGFYWLNEGSRLNVEINLTYIVAGGSDGISKVLGINASKYDVYNVNGVRVLTTTDKAQLDKLGSGLYIINGKKVVINRK